MVVKNALDDVYRELEIVKYLNHPHILRVHEIIDSEESNKLYLGYFYIVQDYCERGSLLE